MLRTIGVILAGGRSSRMGTDKAEVVLAGRTMLDHVYQALSQITEEVVVAGREEARDGITAIPDRGVAHQGPLAGLASARAAHPKAVLVVVAVDQPWVRAETLRELVSLASGLPVLPVEDGIRQTTCAVYPAAVLDGIDEELAAGGSIQSLLDRVSFLPVTDDEWSGWGEDGRSWYSADTMAAIEVGLDRYGPP